jgi:hypothetical protein
MVCSFDGDRGVWGCCVDRGRSGDGCDVKAVAIFQ